ncbi:MAG: hypothetical protein ACHQWU_08980 [Gemmatimonadales bacterium]
MRNWLALAAAAGVAGACARSMAGAAGGDVIDPAEAAKTVVLHVDNRYPSSMELRMVTNGRSEFVGSVGGNDSTSILLDPTYFPTATLFVLGVPADRHGRAVVGPLAATKGDKINFSIQPALDMSTATIGRR